MDFSGLDLGRVRGLLVGWLVLLGVAAVGTLGLLVWVGVTLVNWVVTK